MAILDELMHRQERIEQVHYFAKKQLRDQPEGRIRVCRRGGCTYYYLRTDPRDKKGKYLAKKKTELAQALIRKDYLERVVRLTGKELALLNRYITLLKKGTAEDIYSRLSPARKALVAPLLVTDELCALMWESQAFQQSTFMPEMKIYPTKKGDLVRSKSEMLFADLYTDLGIPYRYEEVITLPDGTIVTPDFTLWDTKRRRTIYHEHFGKMDDPVYRKKNLKKIDDYRRNGIYTGKNLIMTFEGDGAILNMREMRAMMEDLMK
ncbi:MAG: hypothetical protein K6A81_08775 [Clostridiales bacterium]|nr:hypothetical protein [Clostridiales bacterium]